MDALTYQRAVARTGSAVDDAPGSIDRELSLCGMGIAGEAGEVCDLLKKVVHHRCSLDRAKLIEEMGDVTWYLAHLASVLGVSLEEVFDANIAKLKRRYPNGFTTADSIVRADEKPAGEVRSWTREDSHGAVQVTVRIPGEAR